MRGMAGSEQSDWLTIMTRARVINDPGPEEFAQRKCSAGRKIFQPLRHGLTQGVRKEHLFILSKLFELGLHGWIVARQTPDGHILRFVIG